MSLPLPRSVIFLAVPLIPVLLAGWLHPERPDWKLLIHPIPVLDRVAVRNDRILWIDARTADEFRRGHRAGAINLHMANWEEALPVLIDQWTPERPIIVYGDDARFMQIRQVARRLRRELDVKTVSIFREKMNGVKDAP